MLELLSRPWPWYVAGPLIGLMVPLLLVLENRRFGISTCFQHVCAALVPGKSSYFAYDWKRTGRWNLALAFGTLLGGAIAAVFLSDGSQVAISEATRQDLLSLGLVDLGGLVPAEIFRWGALGTVRGFVFLVVGGFLVGFGARYAGGCTSGHAITGLADRQLSSLLAVLGFFAGGLVSTHLLLPLLLGS